MIHMRTFFPINAPANLRAFANWSHLRQEELREAAIVTTDTVTEFLKRQMEKGNWETVREVLRGKPMTKAGRFMLEELRGNLVSKLIFRLGLRKVIAVGLVLVLLPLILAKVAGEVMHQVRK